MADFLYFEAKGQGHKSGKMCLSDLFLTTGGGAAWAGWGRVEHYWQLANFVGRLPKVAEQYIGWFPSVGVVRAY